MISRICQLSCLLLAISAPVVAQDAYPQRRTKVMSAEAATELHVAIMGEVRKPGTYHVDSTTLNLQSVVERAGGFTLEASKAIRIIRPGRATHTEIYSRSATTPVSSGDLLVVDSDFSGNRASRFHEYGAERTTIPAIYEERDIRSLIQVAVVNALDYPIVLRIRPEESSVRNIVVEKLGQPIELLADANIIPPDRFPRPSSDDAKKASRLADTSVIVFDSGRVNRNRLPATLPRPIESEIALGAQMVLIGSPHGQSAELRNLGSGIFSPSTDPFAGNSRNSNTLPTESTISLPLAHPNRDDAGNSNFTPPETSRPRIANVPFSGSARITSSSSARIRPHVSPSDERLSSNESILEVDAELPSAVPLSDEESFPSHPQTPSIPHLIAIVMIVGVLIGAAFLLRRMLEMSATKMNSTVAPIAAVETPTEIHGSSGSQFAEKSLLDRLLKNELPIVTEAVEFPGGLALQGRIAIRPSLRRDGSQNAVQQNGPHYATSHQSSRDVPLKELIAQLDAAETPLIRRPYFSKAESEKVATAAEPVRAGDVSGNERNEPSKAPLANALFELEQGGRS